MYQYSLNYFIDLFSQGVKFAEKSANFDQR